MAILFGNQAIVVVSLLPMSVLGVLLLFAGSQFALTIIDMKERNELFVVLIILGVTLASNLAVGFIVGIPLAYTMKSNRMKV